MTHQEFFNIQYPIICASMNRVSDLKLAVASHFAGILPSFTVYNWLQKDFKWYFDYAQANYDLKSFQDETGSNNLILSIGTAEIGIPEMMNLILRNKIRYLEIFGREDEGLKSISAHDYSIYQVYKENGIKIIPKQLSGKHANVDGMDAILLKGKDGAGRSIETVDMDEEIQILRTKFPDLPLIMSGGIGCQKDIKKYLDMGCIAVAIGTLFAVSEESSISKETKIKMIEASSKDIKRLETGAKQNALIFKKIDQEDDFNNTISLIRGIHNPKYGGHIFAGLGIEHAKSIRPLKDIVQELVDGL